MNKYRILKIEEPNPVYSNEIDINFKIQQKFLWWWFNASIKYAYFANTQYGLDASEALINTSTTLKFNDINEANEFHEKYIVNPFIEYYKKNKIIRVPFIYDGKEMYINKSKQYFPNYKGYEYSCSLDELKSKIDRRCTKPKIMVVN